jgi:hypothetical protein
MLEAHVLHVSTQSSADSSSTQPAEPQSTPEALRSSTSVNEEKGIELDVLAISDLDSPHQVFVPDVSCAFVVTFLYANDAYTDPGRKRSWSREALPSAASVKTSRNTTP